MTQPDVDQASLAQSKARCVACMEPIAAGAKKCVHCGSYQNWRRFLNVGTGMLSLMVALISVLTVATPVFKSALTAQKPEMHYSFLRYQARTMEVICSNLGQRPGILKRVTLSVLRDGSESDVAPIELNWNVSDPIVRPQESKIVGLYHELYGERQELAGCDPAGSRCDYHVEFEVLGPDDTPYVRLKTFPCRGCQ